jgi:hypothetical protein
MNIKEMLEFVQRGLVKLDNDGYIRSEGNTTYQEIKAELASAIANVGTLQAAPAPVVQQVMTAEDVAAMRQGFISELVYTENRLIDKIVATGSATVAQINQAEQYLRTDIVSNAEGSDVVVLAAIAEVLAAVTP